MTAISIIVGEKGETVKAEEKILKGFFIVGDTKLVESNCKTVGISFDYGSNKFQSRITKYNDYAFATIKNGKDYVQHIITPDVDQQEFFDYVESQDEYPEIQQMLSSAIALVGKMFLG